MKYGWEYVLVGGGGKSTHDSRDGAEAHSWNDLEQYCCYSKSVILSERELSDSTEKAYGHELGTSSLLV